MRLMMMAAALALTACGGGGDSTPATAQECRAVTNTTGDIVNDSGQVVIPGTSRTFELCCSAGFVTVTTPDVGGIKGNSTTSCKA